MERYQICTEQSFIPYENVSLYIKAVQEKGKEDFTRLDLFTVDTQAVNENEVYNFKKFMLLVHSYRTTALK
jgi:ureidoglycolate hydrolase